MRRLSDYHTFLFGVFSGIVIGILIGYLLK